MKELTLIQTLRIILLLGGTLCINSIEIFLETLETQKELSDDRAIAWRDG